MPCKSGMGGAVTGTTHSRLGKQRFSFSTETSPPHDSPSAAYAVQVPTRHHSSLVQSCWVSQELQRGVSATTQNISVQPMNEGVSPPMCDSKLSGFSIAHQLQPSYQDAQAAGSTQLPLLSLSTPSPQAPSGRQVPEISGISSATAGETQLRLGKQRLSNSAMTNPPHDSPSATYGVQLPMRHHSVLDTWQSSQASHAPSVQMVSQLLL